MAWERHTGRIRRELSLQWAVGELLGIWPTGEEMIECPLPGHDDSTPSFNLWKIEDGRPTRFGCFGCREQGDVIDLIRMVRSASFYEAIQIADDELIPALRESGWVGTTVDRVRRLLSSEELEGIVTRLSAMSEFGYKALGRFLRAKAEDAGRPELESVLFRDYATGEWGWGGAGFAEYADRSPGPTDDWSAQVVFFPHRTPSGVVTGIKYRETRNPSSRWNEEGSSFPFLYGVWRSRRAPRALICEGETDTTWAAYALRDEAERGQVDVFGLPSGAGQRPTGLKSLSRRDVVYLAFDGDDSGRTATITWCEALEAAGAPRVKVCRVPDGDDILSAKVSIHDMIREADQWQT